MLRDLHSEAPPQRRGLSASEAAQYIGVSPATFTRRVKAGDLPAPVCIAGARRWDRVKLDALFDAGLDVPSDFNEWD